MLGTVTLLVMSASFFNPSFALSSHFDSGRLFYVYCINVTTVVIFNTTLQSVKTVSLEMRKMLVSAVYEGLLE